jgi:hypothetical protein
MSTSSRSTSEPGIYAMAKGIITDYRAALGAVGLVIYGVVRVAHDSFYARFDLTPESVGLSQLVILGRAALYMALFVFVVVGLAGLWSLLWSLMFASWRLAHRAVTRFRRFVAWKFRRGHPQRPVRPASEGKHASYAVLRAFFFLALAVPLLVDRIAPYFMRFLLEIGTVFFSVVVVWILLLGLVLFRAQRLAGFDHRAWSTRICLFACCLALTVPPIVSLLAFSPRGIDHSSCTTHRPYENLLGPMGRFRVPTGPVEQISIRAIGPLGPIRVTVPDPVSRIRVPSPERVYQDLIDCSATDAPLRRPARWTMERALLAWVAILAVLVYITWHRPRDRAADARSAIGSGLTRTEGMGMLVVLAVAGGVAFFVAYHDGLGYANELQQGGSLRQSRFGSFSIQANPVCIASQDGKVQLDEPVMLLGETSTRVIVSQYGSPNRPAGVMKLPASGLLLHYLPGGLGPERRATAQAECRQFISELLPSGDAKAPAPAPG